MVSPLSHTPIDLNRAVQYTEHSIVSTVILKGPHGHVTLFAFDAGEELSEHTTPFDALITVTDGAAAVTIAGHQQNVTAGYAVVLPANIPHSVRAIERFTMMLTMIK